MADQVTIRKARMEDVEAITAIYNDAIVTTTATFDTEPKSVEDRIEWFHAHDNRHPVLVSIMGSDVVGWAALNKWSDRAAYGDTAETSIYIDATYRGKGIGSALNNALVEEARRLGYHTLIARIAEGSAQSLRLHERAGFVLVGVLKQVGRKFGKLIDVHVYQKMLE
jgi:phosphinothricin acetyltransferase